MGLILGWAGIVVHPIGFAAANVTHDRLGVIWCLAFFALSVVMVVRS